MWWTSTAGPAGGSTPHRMASGGRTAWRWGSSERLIPPHRQPDRRGNEAHHAVGLDEVAPLLVRPRVDVLGEEAVPVAAGEQVLEQGARFIPLSQRGEGVDVPE